MVPDSFSDERAREIVKNGGPWIRKQLQIQSARALAAPREYVDGECFTYLGEEYRLKLTRNGHGMLTREGDELRLSPPKDLPAAQTRPFIQRQLLAWFWNQAERQLRERTARYAKILGVKPKAVSVRNYKARWGSCSADGDIRYNWRIIIAPHHMMDSVVVHELCHMLHHNHSPAFWACVARLFPDYKECRKWYRTNGWRLTV